MSYGTRSVTITSSEVEVIVQKAITTALNDITELFNHKLEELDKRMSATEYRLTAVEEQLSQEFSSSTANNHVQSQAQTELSAELSAIRNETRESLLLSNDNEQYSRQNNLRFCGLKPAEGEDCCSAAMNFIKNTLRISSLNETDIEVAHMIAGSSSQTSADQQTSTYQRRRPTMMVRFCRRDKRDLVIRSRKLLKGTHYAVTEDLTSLNTKTMNRLRNHDQVRSTWSWNGKIFAVLSNGHKVAVRPFQPINELLAN